MRIVYGQWVCDGDCMFYGWLYFMWYVAHELPCMVSASAEARRFRSAVPLGQHPAGKNYKTQSKRL